MPLAAALLDAGAEHLVLAGLVSVAQDQTLSKGVYRARRRRRDLASLVEMWPDLPITVEPRVRVSYDSLHDLDELIREYNCDTVLLPLSKDGKSVFGMPVEQVLSRLGCRVILLRGTLPEVLQRILIPSYGGLHTVHALVVGLALSNALGAEVSLFRASRAAGNGPGVEEAVTLPSVIYRKLLSTQEPSLHGSMLDLIEALPRHSQEDQLLVMGTTPHESARGMLGPRTRVLLEAVKLPVIVVYTPLGFDAVTMRQVQPPLAVNVERWFAENTFDSEEFNDVERLVALKEAQGLTISLGLPTLNEEDTIGNVITTVREALMERHPLLDEIVLIDSNSTDSTVEIAESLGIPVYRHSEILPEQGSYVGKGEALWKSLYVLKGDIIVWIDTDIVNIHPRFVYGLVGPLLVSPHVMYVKGFYRRPLRVGDKLLAVGGGRVTELVVRPMLNLFFPELSGLVQPLAGEYAGRREVLERVPFFTGYAVETGLLIDILSQFGLSAIAQVDLKERIHHNQSLKALSKMSFVILQALLARLEEHGIVQWLSEPSRSMKLIGDDTRRLFLDIEEIVDYERPPMAAIPAYRARHRQRYPRPPLITFQDTPGEHDGD